MMLFFWDVMRRELSVSCCDSLLMIHVPSVPLLSVKFSTEGDGVLVYSCATYIFIHAYHSSHLHTGWLSTIQMKDRSFGWGRGDFRRR